MQELFNDALGMADGFERVKCGRLCDKCVVAVAVRCEAKILDNSSVELRR
jgi:hypothetical protein